MNPGERYAEALQREGIEAAKAEREAAKFEPITIVISDQQELRVIYELAGRWRSKPVPMIRRHLRGWGRTALDQRRAEQQFTPSISGDFLQSTLPPVVPFVKAG